MGKKIKNFFRNNSFPLLIIIYVFLVLSVITWGIPNSFHPYLYHMDEWHFAKSLIAIAQHGTSTVPGSGHTPFLHPVSTFIFLSPFFIYNLFTNPSFVNFQFDQFNINSFFIFLRLHTLQYGVLSIIVFYNIVKKFFSSNSIIWTIMFIFTPIFISLSNYYKYDIALLFWILVFLYASLSFIKNPSNKRYLLVGLAGGLALSTKLSAIPLIPIYFSLFFIAFKKPTKKIRVLVYGFLVFLATFLVLGIPDVLIGRANYFEHLYSNLVIGPEKISTFKLDNFFNFWLVDHFPNIFGHALFILFLISFIYLVSLVIKAAKTKRINKVYLFVFISFAFFLISLIPLKWNVGNRGLVLLPFFPITILIFLKESKNEILKGALYVSIAIVIIFQIFETIGWMTVKWNIDPRVTSSAWAIRNIPKNETIGIQNIPIYQMIPDLFLKGYYAQQSGEMSEYRFQVIDSKTNELPNYIVLTNVDFDEKFLKSSEKINIVKRLDREGYKEIAYFAPNWSFYKLFNTQLNFTISNLIPVSTITFYSK